jgi:hypothetical protein
VAEYPHIISRMATTAAGRGKLFNIDDYPSPAEVASMYSIDLYEQEIPSGDFRVNVSQALANDMTKHFQRETDRVVNNIIGMMANNIGVLVNSVINGCTDTPFINKKGKQAIRRGRVFEATLTKIIDHIELLDKFNPTENQELIEIKNMLQTTMQGITADKLRDSDTTRETTKLRMTEVLDKVRKIDFY